MRLNPVPRSSLARLFVLLWFLLLATAYVSYLVQSAAVDWANEQLRKTRPATPFLISTAEAVGWSLRDAPVAQWESAFARSGARFTYPTEIVSLDRLEARFHATDAVRGQVAQGKPAFMTTSDGANRVGLMRLGASPMALAITLDVPPEILVFGVLTIDEFTWIAQAILYAAAVLLWLSFFWRDLGRIIAAADATGRGDFSFRVDLGAYAPLRPLAASLNSMAARVGQLMRSHKDLTNAVSHELRNPLMRLEFRRHLAREALQSEEKDRNLDIMARDLEELDQLADELLTYARLERRDPEIRMAAFDARNMVAQAIEGTRDLARARNVDVKIEAHVTIATLWGEPRYLLRALSNLLANAIRHASRDVLVTVSAPARVATISVEDDGPGIDPAFLPRLFEAFARPDASRTRDTGGTGMGLAITRRVAQWHGGDVAYRRTSLGGACFSLSYRLPETVREGGVDARPA